MLIDAIDPELTDDRGEIRNIDLRRVSELLDGHVPENLAIIKSKAGSVRSNHVHKTGWHWLYVVSGKMRYWEQHAPGSNRFGGKVVRMLGPGELVFTGPGVPHRADFIEDTVLLSLGPAKTHDIHEADLVRVEWKP